MFYTHYWSVSPPIYVKGRGSTTYLRTMNQLRNRRNHFFRFLCRERDQSSRHFPQLANRQNKKTISNDFLSRVFPPNTTSIFLEIRLNRRNRKSAITEFRQIFLCSGGSFGALQRDQIGRF